MATPVSLAVRNEAAMRSIENSLSHFGDVGLMPRRVRHNNMLPTIQLEWVAEKLADMANKIVEEALEIERIEATYESEMQIRAEALWGKREYVDDTPQGVVGDVLPDGLEELSGGAFWDASIMEGEIDIAEEPGITDVSTVVGGA
jgi:hypothetical protein